MINRTYVLKQLLNRFQLKSPNTITNWETKEGFPKHVVIGCRSYWDAEQVDQWYRNKLSKTQGEPTPVTPSPEQTVVAEGA